MMNVKSNLCTPTMATGSTKPANPFERLSRVRDEAKELAVYAERVATNFDGVGCAAAVDVAPTAWSGALGVLETATDDISGALRDIRAVLDRINRQLP